MISRWLDLDDWLRLAVPLAVFGILCWAVARGSGSSRTSVPDGPPDEPYRVFTRDHDLTLRARDVPAALAGDGSDRAKGWALQNPSAWLGQVEAAQQILSGIAVDQALVLRDAFA